MRIKSYFAATVEGAMRAARRELGDEAMLVQSRKAMPEAQHLGAYEVVFAVEDSAEPSKLPTRESSGETGALVRQLAGQFVQMRRQMDRLSSALTTPLARLDSTAAEMHPWMEAVYRELLLTDLSPEVARKVVNGLDPRAIAAHPDATRTSVGRVLERLIEVAPQLGVTPVDGRRPRAVALVGPPGSGKTSALVKLAARYGFGPRRPCQLLSVDTHRIGSAEQLRSFAAILGMACQTLDSVWVLESALKESNRAALVLIDTPGYGAKDIERTPELAAFLAANSWIDKHLVLNATCRISDLERSVERFSRFRPSKLIFTHLDESVIAGNVASVAIGAGMPVSFLSGGQEIPDDLEEASKRKLADLVLSSMMDEDLIAGPLTPIHSSAGAWPRPGGREEHAGRTMATA